MQMFQRTAWIGRQLVQGRLDSYEASLACVSMKKLNMITWSSRTSPYFQTVFYGSHHLLNNCSYLGILRWHVFWGPGNPIWASNAPLGPLHTIYPIILTTDCKNKEHFAFFLTLAVHLFTCVPSFFSADAADLDRTKKGRERRRRETPLGKMTPLKTVKLSTWARFKALNTYSQYLIYGLFFI